MPQPPERGTQRLEAVGSDTCSSSGTHKTVCISTPSCSPYHLLFCALIPLTLSGSCYYDLSYLLIIGLWR